MHILRQKTVVKLVVKNITKEILFLVRSDTHPLYKGQLDLPGGLSKKNEKPIKAVMRELQEETGITVDSTPTLLFYKKILTSSETINYYLYSINIDSLDSSNIKLSNEHKSIKTILQSQIKNIDLTQLTDNYILSAIDFLKTMPHQK